jgi:hypothetical protein
MAMPGLLLYRRRRMGRVVPGMYDLNLSRAKDRMLAQAVRASPGSVQITPQNAQ